jgi:uncharacterized membrane protein (DUF485 family)
MCDSQSCTACPPPQTQPHSELKKIFDSIASAQSVLLDKSIISISGASFSLTIGFIDKLIPLATAKATWALWFALLILASTIIITTLSFAAGEKTARLKSRLCEHEDDVLREKVRVWAGCLCLLNRGRLALFIAGIVLLTGFIFYNGFIEGTSNTKASAQATIQQTVDPNTVPARIANATENHKE